MFYSKIKNCDIANGEGVRVVLFVSGCRNRCEQCFQPETWNFEYGQPFGEDTIDLIIEMLTPDYIRGLTLLGGEPFEPENQSALILLLKRVKQVFPNKDIWCFTGFVLDSELIDFNNGKFIGSRAHTSNTLPLLDLIDILVDGRFQQSLKRLDLNFRGSSNQRIIQLHPTIETKQIILSPLNN